MAKSYEQTMIEQLCWMTGNLLGGLAFGDKDKVEFLEAALTTYQSFEAGTPNDDIYRAQAAVAEALRFGADKMLAQHYKISDE